MDKVLISTKEAAEILGVSRATLKNWRTRKLFGCPFFPADEKHGGTWYYERERVEQLKEVYNKGTLQNMLKLARKFAETNPNLSDNFQKWDSSDKVGSSEKIFYDSEEVADILKVSEWTLGEWRKSGKLKEVMTDHNGLHWYLAEDVHKFKATYKADKSSTLKERLSTKIPEEIGIEVKGLEGELLGMLLLKDGQVIPDIQAILTPDDFYYPDYQVIYKIIVDLYNRKTPPNILTITEELKATKQMSARMLESVIELGETAFSIVYAKDHANRIKSYSTRRQMLEFGAHLHRKASDPTAPLDELFNFANSSLRGIASDNTEQKPKSRADFLTNRFKGRLNDSLKYSKRKTGFKNIDENQIFLPGLYLIGATPACGKTTFCWQLMEQFAAQGETCLYCSYEMSEFELFTKSLAREMFKRDPYTEITAADIRNGATSNLFYEVFGELAREKKSVQLLELREENVDDLLRILRPSSASTIFKLSHRQTTLNLPPTRHALTTLFTNSKFFSVRLTPPSSSSAVSIASTIISKFRLRVSRKVGISSTQPTLSGLCKCLSLIPLRTARIFLQSEKNSRTPN